MGHIIINIIMETAIYSFRLYQVRKFGFVQKFGLNRARKIIKIRNRNPDPYGRQLSGSASRTNWFIHHWLALLYILWRHQKMTSYSLYQSSTNVYFRSEILIWRSSEQCSAKPWISFTKKWWISNQDRFISFECLFPKEIRICWFRKGEYFEGFINIGINVCLSHLNSRWWWSLRVVQSVADLGICSVKPHDFYGNKNRERCPARAGE